MAIQITVLDRSELTNELFYRNDNLFIEAGAGAGKTRSIESKVVDQLIQGIEPSKFVVITFTNKATEEMKARISKAVFEAYEKEQNKDKKEILKKASESFYQVNISTIHSFCNKLLNEYSFDAKISYGVNLLEEEDESKRQMSLFYEWKKSLSNKEIEEISQIDIEGGNVYKKIESSYSALCGLFDNAKIVSVIPETFSDYIKCLTEAESLINNNLNLSQKKATETFNDKLINYNLTKLSDNNEDRKAIELLLDLLSKCGNFYKKSNDFNYGSSSKDGERISTWAKELVEIIKKAAYNKINEYAIKAWEYFKIHRDNENLSNNQLIFKACELINNNKEVREKIAKTIDVIYIDEFQDTDPYQIEFVMSLGNAIDTRKKKENPNKVTSSLFIVGDPKQSIYRFRGADFASFTKSQDDFVSGQNKSNFKNLIFPENFRSSNLIINYVNTAFEHENLGTGLTYNKMAYIKDHIIPTNEDKEKVLAGVYSFPFSKFNTPKSAVSLIKYLKDNHYKVYDEVEGSGTKKYSLREIRYEDFLILTCSKKDIPTFAKELFDQGIPANIQGKFSLGTSEVLRVTRRILTYFLNKNESNKTLALQTLANYSSDPIKTLSELEEKTKNFNAYSTLYYILKNFDIIVSSFNDNKVILFDSCFEQLFEKIAVNENVTKSELLLKLDNYLSNYEESEISLYNDRFDSLYNSKVKKEGYVRIMNAHKSKGLEGLIVFIVDSGGENLASSLKTAFGTNYLNCIDFYKAAKDKEKEEVEQERHRLEYVDVTRAKQVLIMEEEFARFPRLFMGRTFSNDELKPFQLEGTSLPNAVEVMDYVKNEENPLSSYEVSSKVTSSVDEKLLTPRIKETSPSRLEELDDVITTNINEEKKVILRPRGNVFGDVLHRSMELYSLNKDNADVNLLVKTAISEHIEDITDSHKTYYEIFAKKCVKSIISHFNDISLYSNASLVLPEYKFVTMDLINGEDTLLSGSIDLLVINKDGTATIIDYKSDIAGFKDVESFEKKLEKKYSPELKAYERFVKKTFNVNKIDTLIVWVEEKDNNEIAHSFLI